VRNQLPVVQVIEDLTIDMGPVAAGRLPRTFRDALRSVCIDLREGKPLYAALVISLRKWLPTQTLEAIRTGEKNGCLDSVLPVLAESSRNAGAERRIWRTALTYPVIQFVLCAFVILGLNVIVLPFLAQVFEETAEGMPLPAITVFMMTVVHAVRTHILYIASGLLVAVAVWVFSRNVPGIRSVREWIMHRRPFVGAFARDRTLLDFIEATAALSAAGLPLAEAACGAADLTGSPWLQRQARRIARDINAGTDPLRAWSNMRTGRQTVDWLIRTAITAEEPVSNLQNAAQWLRQALERERLRAARLIEPICIVCNGLMVLIACLATFLILVKLIEAATLY
jgi:type IV pilus assembly protein PilC